MKNGHNISRIFLNDKFIQNTFLLKDIKYQFENGKRKLYLSCVSYLAHYQDETFAMSHLHIPFQKITAVA